MSKPIHTLVAYFDDGAIIRRPWRTRRSAKVRRDGPATNQQLALWADHDFWADDNSQRTHRVERAVIYRPVTYRTSTGKTRVALDAVRKPRMQVVAHYLRSTALTNDQERLIERIISAPGVIFANCKTDYRGDVVIERWGFGDKRILPDTIIYRHPTINELIYS